jgi:hypothetical protein
MNVELLRKIEQHLLANPRELGIAVADLASWAVILSQQDNPELPRDSSMMWPTGQKLLDLTVIESYRLFSNPLLLCEGLSAGWPIDLAEAYNKAEEEGDQKKKVEVTVARIERFIATGGRK